MKLKFIATALLISSAASASTAIDGWYGSVFGGYSYFPSNINTHYFGYLLNHVTYNDGYNVGARLGYQSNPIRYELEYTYTSANPERFRYNNFRQNNVKGSTYVNLGMANLYYDFPEFITTISPFVGVGIGYANFQTRLRVDSPFFIDYFKANDNAFAYQGTAGLTYNFSENWAINAAYRYTATMSSDSFGRAFQVQMGNAGIVYRFDQVSYK